MLVFAVNASAEKLGEINPKPGEINPKTGENWKLGDSVEGKIAKIGDGQVNTICNQGQCSDVSNQKQPGLMVGDQVNCKAAGYECAGMSWNCTVIKP